MKKLMTACMLAAAPCMAQNPVLHPSIGLAAEPLPTDAICTVTDYNNDFENNGSEVGDTATDFALYSIDGVPFNLAAALQAGRPVLMVAGSYTCPIFRNKMNLVNTIAQDYAGMLTVVVIYTIEAHPENDLSPYTGQVNPTQQNINQGILYDQPTTYGQRLAIAQDMFDATPAVPDMFYFDGPCNPWWNHYGPAPNNSYLIDTTGIILSKHPWFDDYPDNILCELEQHFGLPTTDCDVQTGGSITVTLTGQNVTGTAGQTVYGTADIVNSTDAMVRVAVVRIIENLPVDWTSSMCITTCLDDAVDADTVEVDPNSTQSFSIDFHTGATPDTGQVRIGFRNTGDPTNEFAHWFQCITVEANGTTEGSAGRYALYPNPTTGPIRLVPQGSGTVPYSFDVFDLNGRMVHRSSQVTGAVDIDAHLDAGTYVLLLSDEEGGRHAEILTVMR
jgi:hypothetical protein